jgi:hypothetical protein
LKSYIVKLAVNILTNNPSPPNINIENNFFFILYLSSVNQYLHDWREVLIYTNTLFYLIQSNMPIRSPQSNMPIRSPQSNMPIRSPQSNMPIRSPQSNLPIKVTSIKQSYHMNWTSFKRSPVLKDHFCFDPKVTS